MFGFFKTDIIVISGIGEAVYCFVHSYTTTGFCYTVEENLISNNKAAMVAGVSQYYSDQKVAYPPKHDRFRLVLLQALGG